MTILAAAGDAFRAFAQGTANATVSFARGVGMVFARGRNWGYQILFARTKIDFAREAGDPMHNSIVVSVVGWIARNFPEAPVRVAKIGPDGQRTYVVPGPAGAGRMLQLLERPNEWFSGVLLWMATIVDRCMAGNAYWYKERIPDGPLKGRVIRLWWLPQKFVEPRGDEMTFITHYEYNPNGERIYRLDPNDVIHFRDGLDPDNPRKGRSKLAAVLSEIYTDQEAGLMTAQLMTNLGVPGVVIAPANTSGPGLRTDPEKVKQVFKEKFGGDGRGEPMVLTAPTDVKVLSWSPEQMNLRELRRIPEERISAVFGVPASVANLGAGLDHNTLTNYPEARAAAYEEAIIPDQRLVAAELEVQFLDEWVNLDDGWDVDFDHSNVRALASYMEAIWKRNQSAFYQGAITRATFKKATNQPVAPDGSDDVYVLPNNFLILSADNTVVVGGKPPPAAIPASNGRLPNGAFSETLVIAEGPHRIAEAKCPECDKLLGKNVVAGDLWCSKCKAERAFGEAAA